MCSCLVINEHFVWIWFEWLIIIYFYKNYLMINYRATRNLLRHPDLQSWVPGWATGKKFLNHRLPHTKRLDGVRIVNIVRVPTRTGKTGKPGKMGRHFPVREKSGNFEQAGKVREKSGKTTQNTGKLRKFQKNIICYFSMIFKWTVYYLLKCIKFSVKKIKH